MANKASIQLVLSVKNALAKGLKGANTVLQKFGGVARKAMKWAAAGLAGLSAGLVYAMHKAEQFNEQIGQIATLTNINVRQAKKEVRSLSAEFGIAKDELTKGLYDALSAGVPADNVFEFMRVAAKTARAGAASAAEAVDILTTAINAYGMSSQDAERVSDAMFTAVRLGKTTLQELAQNFAQVAPIASASGVAMEEVLAAAASLTKQGTPTAQAMTQIRAAILALNENLGDGWSESMSFQDGLQRLSDMAGGSNVEIKKMTGRIEGALAVMALTGDGAKGAAQDLAELRNSVGATDKAFDKMAKLKRLYKLYQALDNIKLVVGDALVQALGPTLERAAVAAARLAERINDWADSDKLKRAASIIDGIVQALTSDKETAMQTVVAIADVIKLAFISGAIEAANIIVDVVKTGMEKAGQALAKKLPFVGKRFEGLEGAMSGKGMGSQSLVAPGESTEQTRAVKTAQQLENAIRRLIRLSDEQNQKTNEQKDKVDAVTEAVKKQNQAAEQGLKKREALIKKIADLEKKAKKIDAMPVKDNGEKMPDERREKSKQILAERVRQQIEDARQQLAELSSAQDESGDRQKAGVDAVTSAIENQNRAAEQGLKKRESLVKKISKAESEANNILAEQIRRAREGAEERTSASAKVRQQEEMARNTVNQYIQNLRDARREEAQWESQKKHAEKLRAKQQRGETMNQGELDFLEAVNKIGSARKMMADREALSDEMARVGSDQTQDTNLPGMTLLEIRDLLRKLPNGISRELVAKE